MRKMLMIACLLSLATMCGCRTDPTPEDRVEQYRKAAEQGNTEAQLYLGSCYFYGDGVAQDKAEAVKWWRRAAEQGNVLGQDEIAWCYFTGKGVEKDMTEAVKWWHKAAEQGFAAAQNFLGWDVQ